MDKVRDTLRDAKWLSSGKRVRFFALAIVAALGLMTVRCAPTPMPGESKGGEESEEYVIQFIVDNKVPGEDKEKSRVTVKVPWQGVKVEVLKLATGKLEDLEPDPEFEPERLVINLEVINADTGDMLTSFNPPIQLEVAYTAKDVQNADGIDKLKLAFWHETDKKWIVLGTQHDLMADGGTEGGTYFATISSWGDRRIAYGH